MGVKRDALLRMSLKYLELILDSKADEFGVIDKFGITHLAKEMEISYNTARKMIDMLKQDGFVLRVGINHGSQIIIRRRKASFSDSQLSLNDSQVSLNDSRLSLSGDPLNTKTLKTLKTPKEKEEYSSSSSRAREEKSTDWMIHPDQITEEEEEKVFFRWIIHGVYLLKGDQSAENLHGAWLFWREHFVGSPELQDELAEHIEIWQSRWSKPGQLRWKPQLVNFLKGYVEGGKWAHPPTPGD